jgi:ClpP class serine protease
MTTQQKQRYMPQGLLAVAPSAIGAEFSHTEMAPEGDVTNSTPAAEATSKLRVAVLQCWGPLEKSGYFFANYQMLKCMVDYTMQRYDVVVIDFDTPGGTVAGLFDTVAELKATKAKYGKKLIGYVSGQCCSAGLALATSCDEIWTSATAELGSIGVIDCRGDLTKLNERSGVKIDLITSGSKKAYGNVNTTMSTAELIERQERVDELAEMFFGMVAEARSIPIEAVKSWEAGTFLGSKAVDLQIANGVSTLDALVARLSVPELESPKMAKYEDAKKAAESLSAEEKAKLVKALSAEDDDKKEDAEGDDEEKDAASEDDEKDAEGEDDKKKDDDKEDAKAMASKALAATRALEKKLAVAAERGKVQGMLAARPDLSDEQRAGLSGLGSKALAIALKAIPVAASATKVVSPVAASVAAINGEQTLTQPEAQPTTFDEKRLAQRARMGLGTRTAPAIREEGDRLVFDLCAPVQGVK